MDGVVTLGLSPSCCCTFSVLRGRETVLSLGFSEITASVATRMTAGSGDTMLRFDLGAVAALAVVVVDAAVVRAVLLRRRVESAHFGHGAVHGTPHRRATGVREGAPATR